MNIAKKLLVGALVVSIVGASGAGALNYIKKSRETEVLVVPVESLASDYYTQDTILDGNIATNVSQNIRIDKDMIVEQIYVSEGDTVSIGQQLVSFDMTLVNMELNIAKMKHELLERDMTKALKRLASLKNGGPIIEDSDSDGFDPTFDNMDARNDAGWSNGGFSYASILKPVLLAAAEDFAEEDFMNGNLENSNTGETVPEEGDAAGPAGEFAPEGDAGDIPQEPADSDNPVQPETPAEPENPEQPEAPEQPGNDDFANEWEMNPDLGTNDDFYQTDLIFYEKLDGTTLPLTGKGTEEAPFIFLCSSKPESIIATGAFLNVMAGYNPAGTELLHEGGYWYQLEFYNDDIILDPENRTESCYGYFLVDGGLLEEPVYPFSEMQYYKEEALPMNPEEPDDSFGGMGGEDGGGSSLSREEAIRLQENRVNTLKINIEESSINIGKLERKVENQVVYAKLDGIVSKVGDMLGGGSGNLLTIKSKQGYYVTGSIGELMLDQIKPGTKLNCMSYQNGNFDATVLEVADYPLDSENMGYYGGDTNPNVSYYRFSAQIDDPNQQVSDGDWLQITLKKSTEGGKKLVLSKAYVRSENGKSYVYKEENGVLKKQYVKIGGNADYGYSVIIQAGLSRDDYIAFPYGKAVVDGAKTRQGTTEELFGY